jgi:polyisoprenoid-binding protein YceI
MKRFCFYTLLICAVLLPGIAGAQDKVIYEVKKGKIEFFSNAPKELIQAASDKLKGVVDISRHTFAFKISMMSFIGFNSPLQREHFNENYMETSIFPDASFTGKIIETVDLSIDGRYEVRAKGKLTIHGIARERIIKVNIDVRKQQLSVTSEFTVLLADHSINIPRVVYNKLAAEINVSLQATLIPHN